MGKSELAAAVALLLTCGDGEERGEVYGCAADRQQASIVFEVAADMVRMCPALNKRVKILASQKRIVYQSTNSFYQVLSAEAYSKHGFNIHGVVFDELHTQPNRKLFDVMTKGSGDARTQPLYFLITTAGTDTNSMGHSDIGVTMNTYTHLGLDDAKNEMIRMEELEQARKEVDKAEDKKPMKQNMFKVV